MDRYRFKIWYKPGHHVEYRLFVGKILEDGFVGTYAHCGSGRMRPEEWDAFVETLPRGLVLGPSSSYALKHDPSDEWSGKV